MIGSLELPGNSRWFVWKGFPPPAATAIALTTSLYAEAAIFSLHEKKSGASDMADYSNVAPPSANNGGGMNDAFKDALQRARQVIYWFLTGNTTPSWKYPCFFSER